MEPKGRLTINMTFGALNYRLCAGRFHRKVDGLVGFLWLDVII
jgi:hypothetical protein